MDTISKIYNVFEDESKSNVLNDQECQFISNVLNSDNIKNNRALEYISAEDVKQHSKQIYEHTHLAQ